VAFCAVDRLTERAVPKDRAVARRAWQFVGTTGGTAADEALQIYVVHAIPGQAKERLAGLASADPRESVRIPSTVRKSAPCPWPAKPGSPDPPQVGAMVPAIAAPATSNALSTFVSTMVLTL
jgi:hypothetical protein